MLQLFRNTSTLTPFAAGSINRLDSLFSGFAAGDGSIFNQTWARFPVAMWEDEDAIHIEAELPGVAEDDVEVTVHQGQLFIKAERRPGEGRAYLYNGRAYGRFERVITLPDAVNTENVQASLTNGVLCIDFSKAPEAKLQKITLKTS